jgi:hypothetical protein
MQLFQRSKKIKFLPPTESISEAATDLEACQKSFEVRATQLIGAEVVIIPQDGGKYIMRSNGREAPIELLIAPTQPEMYIFHAEAAQLNKLRPR